MSNNLSLAGAQPQKQPRFAPLFTSRFFSGIWTNRSPLRDATTSRIVEKFYGQAGDAIIAGSNIEITNKLTLARRPGLSNFDSNSYTGLDRFYEFRLFNPSSEIIDVMVDEATKLSSLYGGVKTLVFTKSAGAGQSYMQSVGNSLYWGDGVDNKKWLQSLIAWAANTQWGLAGSPFFTTFFIDPNGNIQQLTGTVFPITHINVTGDVLTVTSSASNINSILTVGTVVTFPDSMTATFLESQSVTVTAVTTNTFTADFTNADYSASESATGTAVGGGQPVSGGTEPIWSTVVPAYTNDFQGGITIDGSVQWTNRGLPVENWGIQPPTVAMSPTKGIAFNANWTENTFYSPASVVIDTNGNLQQVTTSGQSSDSAPTWNVTLFGTTTDGTVVWTMIQTAAQLVWQSGYAYIPPFTINSVAAASGGSAVYTGVITGGAGNAYAGLSFLIEGFPDLVNNGVFACTASTANTLTLSNGNAVAQTATNTGLATQTETVQYVIGNAAGVNSLFRLTPSPQPTLSGSVSAYLWAAPTSGPVGAFIKTYPLSTGTALASDTSLNSLSFVGVPLPVGATLTWNTVNGAGEATGTTVPFPSYQHDYQLVIEATLNVPVAGPVSFSIQHHDGMFWGIGGGATLISGTSNNPYGQTVTAVNGYPVMGGTNLSGTATDIFSINFPTAGQYPIEINYDYWYHSGQILNVLCNGNVLANGTLVSGATQPSWPGFSVSFAPNYATVSESAGNLVWSNIGPVSDYVWAGPKGYTLPDTIITDTNGYFEAPFRSGFTGTTQPTWNTGTNNLTIDNPNLIWINEGLASSLPSGTISTFNGGWEYTIALVNTLDNTVSNAAPLSAATGNFVGLNGIDIAAGDGLPPIQSIDPQADYVAIFRTTDGQSVPFLIPGVSTTYTLTLADYLANGYVDTTPDTGLNNLISAAINGENTPPGAGAINLTFHLDRIWYSIGNVVSWTTGPATPVGNGVNGTSPLNYAAMPSLVKRIVPTASGAFIFTVSDVYIIQGNGTASSPIQGALPIAPGIGLLSYNSLDMNGPIIGLFTTDNQFVTMDPSNGISNVSLPIGDQLRLQNGLPGQNWNPANVYVAWHVQGEDQGWYVGDGQYGWYRLMSTPAPETGNTWSPFATLTGGIKAIQSVEVSPGVHRLLVGPYTTGEISQRDLTVFSDNGTTYPAYATIGSLVLTQPGQVAQVAFVTTNSVRTGSPLTLGILVDEALPYYTGPIDILKDWVNDPPNFKISKSFYKQRFYLSTLEDETSSMETMQLQIIFSPFDSTQNELLTLTIFGTFSQEL